MSAWQAQIPATIERELRESEQRGERLRQVEEKVQALIRGGAQHWRVQHADRAAVLAQGIELSDIAVLLGPFDTAYVEYRGTADCPQLLVNGRNLVFRFDPTCRLEAVHHQPRPH